MRSQTRWQVVLVAALLGGPLAAQDRAPAAGVAIEEIAWLAGTWVQAGPGATVEERWTAAGGGSMLGVSRTIKGGKLVAYEFLRIAEHEGRLAYLAQPNGRCPVTAFPLVAHDATSVTFANPQHDFPQTIRYTKRGDGSLEARVSGAGGGQSQSWVFQPARP